MSYDVRGRYFIAFNEQNACFNPQRIVIGEQAQNNITCNLTGYFLHIINI
jgi:hypothetical protein